ncbi:MAG: AAA family ATPase [Candidatus Odinarchaeia archaeon]
MREQLFEYASKLAREAVQLDKQGLIKQAIKKYTLAADTLIKYLKTAKNTHIREVCYKAAQRYIERATKLKEISAGRTRVVDIDEDVEEHEEALDSAIEEIIVKEKPDIKWEDVADLREAKQVLREAIVLPLMRPDLFTGSRRPWKGILLFGPPGCGKCVCPQEKILLASHRAVEAGELLNKLDIKAVYSKKDERVYKVLNKCIIPSFNPDDSVIEKSRIKYVYTKKNAECIKLHFGCDQYIEVGGNHLILVHTNMGMIWKRAKCIKIGDRIAKLWETDFTKMEGVIHSFDYFTVRSVKKFNSNIIDFEVEGAHTYFNGLGVVYHNTFISKAIANEVNASFFNADAASLVSKWLGESEKLVKALFKAARRNSPAIIFLDEVDALTTSRSGEEVGGERRLKTQLLIEMDGLKEDKHSQIVVIGATNRPWDLDPAFRRRFEKRIYIPLPDFEARKEVFRLHLRDIELDETVDFAKLAELTEGYSSSDIAMVCREAAMIPIRELDMQGLLNELDVKVRPINMEDLLISIRKIKPAVSAEEINRYLKWAREYGTV